MLTKGWFYDATGKSKSYRESHRYCKYSFVELCYSPLLVVHFVVLVLPPLGRLLVLVDYSYCFEEAIILGKYDAENTKIFLV